MSGEKSINIKGFTPFRFITGKIRNKLLSILLGISIGTLLVAGVALYTMKSAQETVTQAVDLRGRVVELSTEARQELQAALGLYQDYRLNYKYAGGFDKARAKYVDPAMVHLDTAEKKIIQIEELDKAKAGGSVDTDKLRKNALQQLGVYRTTFLDAIDALEKRGHKDFGYIGDFRNAVHDIEDIITKAGLAKLQVTMLMTRRHEKDYLLRGEEKYIKRTRTRIGELKDGIQASSLSSQIKKESSAFADQYLEKFNQVIAIDKVVAEKMEVNASAAQEIVALTTSIVGIEKSKQTSEIAAMNKQNATSLIIVVAASVLTLLLGILAAFFFAKRLTLQIDKITDMFSNIGIGDFSSRAEVVTQDELGEMAESLNAMLDNTLTLIQSREERDAIQDSIMNLLEEISDLADGDLTARAKVTEEITGAVADAFNTMAEQLSRVVHEVKNASEKVNVSTMDVEQVTQQLSELSDNQAKKVQEAISTIDQMAMSIKEVSKSAGLSSEVSGHARKTAREGSYAVKKTNDAMSAIKENMRNTARTVKRLGESSQEIGNIVQIINDISDRTSILALNASIQASMAGDEGRGFGVVAEEIQRLAERSADSTKQIDTLIRSIQGEISEATRSMEKSIEHVAEGTELADDAYSKLVEIDKVSDKLADIINKISESSVRQSEESDRITEMMRNVGLLTGETTKATKDTAESMQKISFTSKQLHESIMVFKVADQQLASA